VVLYRTFNCWKLKKARIHIPRKTSEKEHDAECVLRVHGSGEGGRGLPRSIRAAAASTDLAGSSTGDRRYPRPHHPRPCCRRLTPIQRAPARARAEGSPVRARTYARHRARPRRLPRHTPSTTMLPDSRLRSSVCGSCSCASVRRFATAQATAASAAVLAEALLQHGRRGGVAQRVGLRRLALSLGLTS
jgi:hypothetical protein